VFNAVRLAFDSYGAAEQKRRPVTKRPATGVVAELINPQSAGQDPRPRPRLWRYWRDHQVSMFEPDLGLARSSRFLSLWHVEPLSNADRGILCDGDTKFC